MVINGLTIASADLTLAEGGWPTTSLPKHVALGKFSRGVSMFYNEETLVEDFLRRATY
jgi:hypothetical protein